MMICVRSHFLFLFLSIALICSGQVEEGENEAGVINGVAVPIDFPELEVFVHENTAAGEIFLSNNNGPPYLMMFENDGTPVFYEKLEYLAMDFKLHQNGMVSYALQDDGVFTKGFVIRDNNFEPVDTVSAAKGFKTDYHDMMIAPNGNYLLIGVSYREVDMSLEVPDGRADAQLKGCHIHELNSNHELVFEWECWDHFEVTDAIGVDLTQKVLDYVHMNSVAVDYDGHLVVSNRHLSECTKINRQTGEIIWRLGGKHNQFEWINDSLGISYQHHIRPVEGKPNHYTIFDNGNYHEPHVSRAIEVLVDLTGKTVEVVWEYRHSPDIFNASRGSVQRLENGNSLINYANILFPKVYELTPDGDLVYKADLKPSTIAYRTYRFDWTGVVPKPSLTAERYPDYTRLIFNKFGDQTVDYYRIYSGDAPGSLVPVDSTAYTWRTYNDLADSSWIYFGVSAIHLDGSESPLSDLAAIFNFYRIRGDNLIFNGDFSMLSTQWLLDSRAGANALGMVVDEVYDVEVVTEESVYSDILLTQEDIPLIQGNKYRLEFDIRADQRAYIGVGLYNSNISSRSDYSMIGIVSVSEIEKHCSYEFVMTASTDLNARLDFQLGRVFGHLYIDNVSLREVPEPIVAELSESSNISCFSSKDGFIRVSGSGGEGALRYLLLPGSEENNTGEFTIENGGIYTVEVRDETAQDPARIIDISINEPEKLIIEDMEIFGVSQDNLHLGALVVHASGSNGEYIFTLLPDSVSNSTGYFPQLDTGRYQVSLTDLAGCDSILSDEVVIDFSNSTMDNTLDSWCRIYPNPARDYLYIKESGEMSETLTMLLYDSMGRVLLQREFRDELVLRLEKFSEGIYFVRIEDEAQKRFIWRKLLII